MKMSIILPAVLLVVLCTSRADAQALYRCSAKQVMNFEDDGTLGQPKKDFFLNWWTNVLIDTASGVVRRPNSPQPLERWTVLQRGNDEYDFVATDQPQRDQAPNDLLRVRNWRTSPQPMFIMMGLSFVVTGTCAAVK